MRLLIVSSCCFLVVFSITSCSLFQTNLDNIVQWEREASNPVFRDVYESEEYESAADGHVFFDDNGDLHMIYSGDVDGVSSIKLAKGTAINTWEQAGALLFEVGPSNIDINKETAFYRKTATGTHQIYYIGYEDGETYRAQVFLAEAENIAGPYEMMESPIVSRGEIAGKEVYCITSPSVNEHEGKLYMSFIGWNNSPSQVTRVWIFGAISEDEGKTWSDFKEIDVPIGMEGQITKRPDGGFVAVRTGEIADVEGVFYSTADHPHGPWTEGENVILYQDDVILEKDEVIAPQITFDPHTGQELLFYTGADYEEGWWMMLARKRE